MKEFIKKLFSGNDEVSSKRFISLVALMVYVAIVVCAFFKINIPEYLFYGTLGLITGASVLTIPSLFTNKPGTKNEEQNKPAV